MKKQQIRSSFLLLLTAVIWGSAFVAQSVGMDYVGPFTFNAVRSLIGGIVLIPCIYFLNRGKEKEKIQKSKRKNLVFGGICCGIALMAGNYVYECWKSRIYYSILYYNSTTSWIVSWKKVYEVCMDWCYYCIDWLIFFMYDGIIFCWKRRFFGFSMCDYVFDSYFDH